MIECVRLKERQSVCKTKIEFLDFYVLSTAYRVTSGRRESERQRKTDRDRERQTDMDKERQTDTDRERERHRQTDRERDRDRERCLDGGLVMSQSSTKQTFSNNEMPKRTGRPGGRPCPPQSCRPRVTLCGSRDHDIKN